MKGVLIDKGRKHGTFLTGNGEFVKGKHMNRDIGEEFVIEKSGMDIKKTALIMMLVIALVGGYIPYNSMTSAYGYVEIDINPSVEIGYNENMKVIKINALNDEGKDILANMEVRLKGMQLDDAVEAIIAYAESKEYSTDDVVLTYTHSDEDDIDEAVEEILCSISDGDGNVTCVDVDKEEYKELRKQNNEGEENTPPAVHVLRNKIADLDSQLAEMRKINGEMLEISDNGNKFMAMEMNYEEIEKVSDLAHIMNQTKKALQEEEKINRELEKQKKENNKNKNSGETVNQENEQEENGKAKGHDKDKNNGNGKGNQGTGN